MPNDMSKARAARDENRQRERETAYQMKCPKDAGCLITLYIPTKDVWCKHGRMVGL